MRRRPALRLQALPQRAPRPQVRLRRMALQRVRVVVAARVAAVDLVVGVAVLQKRLRPRSS